MVQPSVLLCLSRVCFYVLCPLLFPQFFYSGVYLEQYVKLFPPARLLTLIPCASFHLEYAATQDVINIHTASAFCSISNLFLPLVFCTRKLGVGKVPCSV